MSRLIASASRLPMRSLVVAALLLAALSRPGPAEIYQWTDETGTVHFTDELSAVPPALRDKVRPLRREPPIAVHAPPPAYPAAPQAPAPPGAGEAPWTEEATDPVTEAEQLRAKIAAKEQLIESVDKKRSLATNPLRNRFVAPADMELYRKYEAELPGDRERLKALESRIDSLSR